MEKFNTWADAYTGEQPFLPLPSSPASGLTKVYYYVKWFLLSPLVALLKLPFVLLFLALLVLSDRYKSLLGASLTRFLHYTFGGLLLLLLGFYNIETKYTLSKRGNKMPTTAPGSKFGRRDLIVANRCSYVELIYLLHKYSPTFTVTPNSWGSGVPQGKVKPLSFYEALYDTIYQPVYTEDQCMDTSEVIKRAPGITVFFPEGTCTNGKVLLGCVPVFDQYYENVHIIAFKYEHQDFSPVYTVGSFLYHFYKLTGQFENTMYVRHLIDEDIPKWTEDWNDKLFDLLASVFAKRRAKIMVDQKAPFRNYFYQHQTDYRKKKN